MRNQNHLSEEMLNMYLDGELRGAKRDHVEDHLSVCPTCRAELAALQRLFSALEALAPAPNLVPGVLNEIRPRRQQPSLRQWLGTFSPRQLISPLLQLVVALGLLVWLPTRLDRYRALVDRVPSWQEIGTALSHWRVVQWIADLWPADLGAGLSTWSGTLRAGIEQWVTRLSSLPDLQLSMVQLAVLGGMLVILWLVGNVVLLRRASLNGRVVQVKRR